MNIDNKDPLYLRQIIMDHYSNPRHKGLTKQEDTLYIHQASDSCIDDLQLELLIKDDVISNASFEGVGCAISTSTTDIIADLIINKSVSMAITIIENYLAMIYAKPYQEDLLDELVAFTNVPKQPNRIKCATIGVNGYLKLLTNDNQ
ncbi:Fe-S cluster assembly sulfur transfer protein SufU [Spiroplasma chrysopicola]|uniref:FeS assembly protein n=1 Tax=Spiroplasma chrysopicola DF-1 TaxID=1276227 RepID=R4U2E2_9MOLU|nr:SUF system NifU family Fe-S cluster assembly protein [Spiroplasma chrysopicola]AGM25532.1 FeS assembly protein [Spiroplasma chrysopicola DF-1]